MYTYFITTYSSNAKMKCHEIAEIKNATGSPISMCSTTAEENKKKNNNNN